MILTHIEGILYGKRYYCGIFNRMIKVEFRGGLDI